MSFVLCRALAKLYCFCLLLGMEGGNLVYDVVYYFCLLIGTEGVNVVYGVVYYFCLLIRTEVVNVVYGMALQQTTGVERVN